MARSASCVADNPGSLPMGPCVAIFGHDFSFRDEGADWGTPQPDSGRFAAMPGDKKDIARVFESFRDEKRHELIAETAAQYVPLSVGGHGHTTPTGGLNRTHRTLPMAAKWIKWLRAAPAASFTDWTLPMARLRARASVLNTHRYAQKNVRPFGADGYPGAGRGCPPKRGITRMFRGAISRPRVPDQGRHGPGAGKPDSDGGHLAKTYRVFRNDGEALIE